MAKYVFADVNGEGKRFEAEDLPYGLDAAIDEAITWLYGFYQIPPDIEGPERGERVFKRPE